MKKSILFSVFLFTVIYFSGCKTETKTDSTKDTVSEAPKSSAKFSLKEAENNIIKQPKKSLLMGNLKK